MLLFAAAASRRRVTLPAPTRCDAVRGLPSMLLSTDGGKTFSGNEAPAPRNAFVRGLAALDATTVLAATIDALYQSDDGGCGYRIVAALAGNDLPPSITAAGTARAYVWSRTALVRWDRGSVTQLVPPGTIGAVAGNGDEVRIAGTNGTIWESHDAGGTWTARGATAESVLLYDAAFDPKDLDHVVRSTRGIEISRDGGRTWTASASPSLVVYDLAFSPVDSNVVWAAALEGILLSTDGGASFHLAEAGQVAHDYGIIVPSRTDAAKVYWMWVNDIHTLGSVVAKVNGLERFDVVGNTIYAARSEHIIFF